MYCAIADLITRFGEDELLQLSDRNREGEINEAVVTQAIADASAEIDGYLVGRYALPLSSIPSVLQLYACDIARYRLFEDGAYEQVVERYQIAVRYLRDVASGRIELAGVFDERLENEAKVLGGRRVFGGGGF